MANKQLTEKQEKFLEALFGEARGITTRAKQIAGYSDNTPVRDVVMGLEAEIEAATRKYLTLNAPKNVFAVEDIIDTPTALGNREKLAAARDLLDRAGTKAVEKVEVSSSNPLFILPPKESNED